MMFTTTASATIIVPTGQDAHLHAPLLASDPEKLSVLFSVV
jgi:hypothetical protein